MRVKFWMLAWIGLLGGLLRPAICHAHPWLIGVLAQAQQPAAGGGIKQVGGGKNYFWEIAVTVVMFGIALYAVCRSSRRQ
jgi:hypothetical protein